MGLFKRQNITNSGLNGLAEKSINDNFMNIFQKMNGNIDYENVNKDVQNRLNKQWIPFQCEGNFDKFHCLEFRFYVAPNIKIQKGSFSIILSNYRMDSGVATANKMSAEADISISGGTQYGGGFTTEVLRWATNSEGGGFNPPSEAIGGKSVIGSILTYGKNAVLVYHNDDWSSVGIQPSVSQHKENPSTSITTIDYNGLQHIHKVGAHGHNFSGTSRVTFPQHDHPLEEGIKISGTLPSGIAIGVNGTGLGIGLEGNAVLNDKEITGLIKNGWNTMIVTTNTLARATVYGVIEGIIEE